MRKVYAHRLRNTLGGLLGALFLVPAISAGGFTDHKDWLPVVDMPVSLAIGTVQTPAFPVKNKWYDILIQADRVLPSDDMRCMMGATLGPIDFAACKKEVLLQADWTVLDEGKIVAQGSSSHMSDEQISAQHIIKFLGTFRAKAGRSYVVEVRFKKDGTPLNVTSPHLIVNLDSNYISW